MSTPMTRPVWPTRRAASKQSIPPPDPMSSTVSPGLTVARPAGVPHPYDTRSTSSGTKERRSSKLYPVGQHICSPVVTALAYRSLTCCVIVSFGMSTSRKLIYKDGSIYQPLLIVSILARQLLSLVTHQTVTQRRNL